ncbi:hypothetical protein FGG08_002151 [Glutinoglossum americanum]|uniref:Uncharacterized protein n=1 Tax=Glutinoglossum americanum TaxID=1670608 RepID=A0A9P8IC99_9PEZI|nr:hypothetical protein FGG08_002151 [Glutinoglossum americanum]
MPAPPTASSQPLHHSPQKSQSQPEDQFPAPPTEPTSARLSLPFQFRFPLSLILSSIAGASLGLSHGSRNAGLRFRAENAHRLPTTPTGWYLYHKSKNYHVALGGLKEGARMGFRIGWWAGMFVIIEEAVDRLRYGRGRGGDFLSTVVAGLGVAGGFSAWNRFPLPTAARTAKSGLLFGLAFGLAQDAVSFARGRRLAYVEFLFGKRKREEGVDGDRLTS